VADGPTILVGEVVGTVLFYTDSKYSPELGRVVQNHIEHTSASGGNADMMRELGSRSLLSSIIDP
jgi:hypothetical protein